MNYCKGLTIMISLMILFGCTQKEPGRYYHKEKKFSIKLPEKWEQKENYYNTLVMSLSPMKDEKDEFRENINIVTEDLLQAYTAEQYLEAALIQLKYLFTDLKEEARGNVKINGQDAVWICYYYKMGQAAIKSIQYFLIKDKRAYVITCTANPVSYDEFKSEFEKVALSFKLE